MRCTCLAALFVLCGGLAFAEESKSVGVTPAEAKRGFVSLFDGKTLDGWQGDVKGYAVEDGAIVCHGSNLYTKKEYANFILRFEVKVPPATNSGAGIRAPLEGPAAFNGIELQIIDNDGWEKKHPKLEAWQYHGSIYGVVPAKQVSLKPAGQWNTEEIIADGSHIKVTLNGTVIVDVDIAEKKPIDDHEHPGLHNAKGYIGWQGHGIPGDPVAFRNIRIKELP